MVPAEAGLHAGNLTDGRVGGDWDPDSELSRLNHSTRILPFPVSPETFEVFKWFGFADRASADAPAGIGHVIDTLAVRADAFDTALMVLGMDEGMALARELDLAALVIEHTAAGFIERATPRFEAIAAKR